MKQIDYIKANRRGSREAELEFQTGAGNRRLCLPQGAAYDTGAAGRTDADG